MDDQVTRDEDFLVWTTRQARVLRSLDLNRSVFPNDFDPEGVAEEIEDLGRSELNAVKSYLRNIFIHLIKLADNPASPDRLHWIAEVLAFHRNLGDRFTPSMAARIDIEILWRQSVRDSSKILVASGRESAIAFPDRSPFEIEDFIAGEVEIPALVARIHPGARDPAAE